MNLSNIKYSLLDLAVITEGQTAARAIENSRDLAIHAEEYGYTRFWMAEHHNMENIASSATSVLLGHMAEATNTIRIGSGGVMLPNHSPLIIAEHYGTLATMYPDRVDLGLGRAPGTDQTTAQAIRPDRMRAVQQFPQNVQRLQRYLGDNQENNNVRAIPGMGTDIPIWILGSSTDSAQLAAALGLPYVFASHFAPQQLMPALKIYREQFEPSEQLSEPYVMPAVHVVAADTSEEAEYLSTSMKQMFKGIITGDRTPMAPPVDDMDAIWNLRVKMAAKQMLTYSFVGSKGTIKDELTDFIEKTKADEIMMASYLYDHEQRIKSHRLFAELMRA